MITGGVSMRVEDYFQAGKRWKFRFMEKGGKYNEVFAHHHAEAYLDHCAGSSGYATTVSVHKSNPKSLFALMISGQVWSEAPDGESGEGREGGTPPGVFPNSTGYLD